MKGRTILILLIIAALLLVLALPALALDESTPPGSTINPAEIPTWQDFLVNAATVFVVLGTIFAYPSQIVVSILKAALARLKPNWMPYVGAVAFVVPLAFAGLYWTADYFNFAPTFVKATNFLLQIAPIILAWAGIQVGQTLAYRVNKKLGAPVAGADANRLLHPLT